MTDDRRAGERLVQAAKEAADMAKQERRAALVERMARAICQEKCAFMGEPPCWDSEFANDPFPPPACCEPRCDALASAARDIALEEAARVAEATRDDGLDKFAKDDYARLYGRAMATDIAAAIRALKSKP